MASKIDINLAKKLFALQKRGGNFPPQVRAAARKILQGKGSKADGELIKQALGISKSGATEGNRQFRGINRGFGMAVQIGQSVEMIEQGGSIGSAGVLNLVNIGKNQLEQIAKSKAVEKIFTTVAQKVTGDPVKGLKVFYGMNRLIRQGGAVFQAAMVGWDIGKAIQSNRQSAIDKKNAAQGGAYDLAHDNNVDWLRAQEQVTAAGVNTRRDLNWFERLQRRAGFDVGYQDQVNRRIEQRQQNILSGRKVARAGYGGFDVNAALAAYAAGKGKTIQELSSWERDQVIDSALENETSVDQYLDDPRIETELSLQTPWEKISDYFASEDRMAAKRRDIITNKIIPSRQREFEKKQQDAQLAAERAERAFSPAQRLQNRSAEEYARATFNSYRSRHKAWSND